MANNTNPTGYAVRPSSLQATPSDFGPLFSASPRPSVSASSSAPLPRSVEVAASDSGRRRQRILQLLANEGPMTIHEMCRAFSSGQVTTTPNQISGRITDLKRDMLIAAIGQRPGPGPAHCACDVYELTAAGRDELDRAKRKL